ncbi:PREDICTED: uncharacterized protein LOC105313492 [Amphimedon queenslandica]|uniref:SH3 domain-containing protein n=1 Tax=Amphimedon queenslandica TaxID=400682 RepID=A0A1X7UFL0_AMPQE|nr:PREDICTED: uncharacterized protein LOC105313492 [Amphimedon queenslandica]|eukprot:XP_019854603.1 PREDICTED: uncharacterized protein LOC105313492 [Amphimedon queenslandica]
MTADVHRMGQGQTPLFARARYPNQADAEDELTFRKDEILQVLEKDYKGQVDWWLCRLGENVGMVPANYLEIFHPHSPKPASNTTSSSTSIQKEKEDISEKADYDIPKSQSKGRANSANRTTPPNTALLNPAPHELDPRYADYDFPRRATPGPSSEDIYDLPPPEDNDYDFPPVEISSADPHPSEDRPPSSKSYLSTNTSNRVSSASVSSTNQIYDIPPASPSAIYDTPPLDAFGDSPGSRRGSGEVMDVTSMYENEAEEFLSKSKTDIDRKFDDLWQCVYGNNAYWGSEMKMRRKETLQRTLTAAKDLDNILLSLVAFGKGVHMALESSNMKDANFKKKYLAANAILVNKKKDILSKIELLEADEKDVPVTATVKSLLEGARTIPQAVQAFVILVQANRTILFKSSVKSVDELLPVLTKSEVKNRPLPELPEARRSKRLDSGSDYADISMESEDNTHQMSSNYSDNTLGANSRRRNPQDILPPLPFATLRKAPKKKASPSPMPNSYDGDDYDDIDGAATGVPESQPPPLPPRTDNYLSPSTSKSRHPLARQSSGSSDGSGSPMRSRSPDVSSNYNPYGRPNGMRRSNSPPSIQPLRQEDKELLARYCQQMELLVPGLKDAIQTFLESIRNSESPKEFVIKSKLSVVAAYKLVYIADSLHQKLLHNDIKATVASSSNQLTDTIKSLVTETKTAALQYPSVAPLDKMKESLKALFPACLDLVSAVKNPPQFWCDVRDAHY